MISDVIADALTQIRHYRTRKPTINFYTDPTIIGHLDELEAVLERVYTALTEPPSAVREFYSEELRASLAKAGLVWHPDGMLSAADIPPTHGARCAECLDGAPHQSAEVTEKPRRDPLTIVNSAAVIGVDVALVGLHPSLVGFISSALLVVVLSVFALRDRGYR